MTRSASFEHGRDFVLAQARVLEQRLFAALFEGGPPGAVVDALLAYRNEDGGFGHGLEPDKRCPDSQPLDVEVALETMDAAGTVDEELARAACGFLTTVSDERGYVPIVLPSVAGYPRANHWADGDFPPELWGTIGIAAYLHKLGVAHPWRDRATASCLDELERGPTGDAHVVLWTLLFLEHVQDRERAEALVAAVSARLRSAAHFRADADSPEYGVTPLHYAPRPDSRWRSLFTDDEIEAHLDRLEADQAADGGWPLTWQPPSQASTLEWRGRETVRALSVLTAYGRLEAG